MTLEAEHIKFHIIKPAQENIYKISYNKTRTRGNLGVCTTRGIYIKFHIIKPGLEGIYKI